MFADNAITIPEDTVKIRLQTDPSITRYGFRVTSIVANGVSAGSGNGQGPNVSDANPFRYCGEYFDAETGTYYLRARYYNPSNGRFRTEDTHWNIRNMVYGSNPVKWTEREPDERDPLGLNTYTYKPDIMAIMQSGNLYVYGLNNPVMWIDPSGEVVTPANVIGAVIGAGGGYKLGTMVADYYELTGWKRNATISGFTVGGAAVGWFAGPLVEKLAMQIAIKMGLVVSKVVHDTWQQAEVALRTSMNSVMSVSQRTLYTPFGNRVVDALNTKSRLIGEAKYGYQGLSSTIQQQIQKDVYLIGQGYRVEWHFFWSRASNTGGMSATLREALNKAGIKIIEHY